MLVLMSRLDGASHVNNYDMTDVFSLQLHCTDGAVIGLQKRLEPDDLQQSPAPAPSGQFPA